MAKIIVKTRRYRSTEFQTDELNSKGVYCYGYDIHGWMDMTYMATFQVTVQQINCPGVIIVEIPKEFLILSNVYEDKFEF